MVLIFFLVLVVLFWTMPDEKVDSIGDFFSKLINPLSTPLSCIIVGGTGIYKGLQWHKKKKERFVLTNNSF